MTVWLNAIGLAQPASTLTLQQSVDIAARSGSRMPRSRIQRFFESCGVLERAVVLDGIDDPVFLDNPTTSARMQRYASLAPPLAHVACIASLQASGRGAQQITHLVTASCTGFASPGVEHALIGSLELPPSVERTHVGFMGCHGAINAIAVASAIAENDPDAAVLVCCVELCSLHYNSTPDDEQMIANALFGDGAAACVVSQQPGGWRVGPRSSLVLDRTSDLMGWTIGDHGFTMSLSQHVPSVLRESMPEWIRRLAERAELSVDGIAGWAIHPGGPSIIDAVGHAAGLDESQMAASRHVLSHCGNMSSPTVLFVLDEIASSHGIVDTAMLAFGPGLSAEGLVLHAR